MRRARARTTRRRSRRASRRSRARARRTDDATNLAHPRVTILLLPRRSRGFGFDHAPDGLARGVEALVVELLDVILHLDKPKRGRPLARVDREPSPDLEEPRLGCAALLDVRIGKPVE